MGYILWPISMVAVFGYRYITRWYEQDRRQLMKLVCIGALIASGIIFIYWGLTLGMIVAGIVQLVINLVKYSEDPAKLEAELGTEFRFSPKDILGPVLMMAIMVVVCIFAFLAVKSYLKVLRVNIVGQVPSRSLYTNSNKKPEAKPTTTKKPQKVNSVFCSKCGTRIPEGSMECPSCSKKSKK